MLGDGAGIDVDFQKTLPPRFLLQDRLDWDVLPGGGIGRFQDYVADRVQRASAVHSGSLQICHPQLQFGQNLLDALYDAGQNGHGVLSGKVGKTIKCRTAGASEESATPFFMPAMPNPGKIYQALYRELQGTQVCHQRLSSV